MKKYNVFDTVFDFVGCSQEASKELDQIIADFECHNGHHIDFDLKELGPDYPNLASFIKGVVGEDTDPVLINVWW